MARTSRSPSPSSSRPFRRHYSNDNPDTRSERNRPPRKDDGYRGDRNSYRRDRSERDTRDYRSNDRERDRGRYGREKERERSRRSASPPSRPSHHASRRTSRSPPPPPPPPPARPSRPRSHSRPRSKHDDGDEDEDEETKKKKEDKLKPNFNRSGLLAAETKTVKSVDGTKTVLKYHEPPEARKPMLGWRLYVFKGSEQVDLLHIHRQSAYLIGRDRAVADISIDHPSCSKQHAVIQYRSVQEKDEFGGVKTQIKPFIIDLESTNGTHVNDKAIPVSRYYELMQNDIIKFGDSTREYVLLHDEAS